MLALLSLRHSRSASIGPEGIEIVSGVRRNQAGLMLQSDQKELKYHSPYSDRLLNWCFNRTRRN